MAQCQPDRRQTDRAARDRSADELHHDARGDGALNRDGVRIALPAAIDAAALAARDPSATVATLRGETMGTSWSALLVADAISDTAALHHAIEQRLDGLVAEMSHWEPTSLLSRFNRAAAESWTALPPDFAQVIAAGLAVAERSGGAFDPAIGRLVNLWGFGPVVAAAAPGAAVVEAALGAGGWQRLAFDPASRRLRQPGGVALDLSGIAKGYAVDAVAALLRARGVRHGLVEIGGELAGWGVRPDGEPWWVDLEVPPGLPLPPLRVAMHGLAVATSGNYRRGEHNLDPRTGRPLAGEVVSVSVIGGSAMLADAWATALTVLGPDAGLALARAEGLAARIVSRGPDGVCEALSPALTAMLDG